MREANFTLHLDLHEKARTVKLKSFVENKDFLDVTIACDDDQIDAHKVILSAASPFFETILKRNPHQHPLLYLRGTRRKDIEALLCFIYSGETQVLNDELEEFMALANSLQVHGLAGAVNDVVRDEVEIDTSREIKKEKDDAFEEQFEANAADLRDKSLVYDSVCNKTEGSISNENKESKNRNKTKRENQQVNFDISERKYYDRKLESSNLVDPLQDSKIVANSIATVGQVKEKVYVEYEYDQKVLELVAKTESGWTCTKCTYISIHKSHIKEHAERHIQGYSHNCEYCSKTYTIRRKLKEHIKANH